MIKEITDSDLYYCGETEKDQKAILWNGREMKLYSSGGEDIVTISITWEFKIPYIPLKIELK